MMTANRHFELWKSNDNRFPIKSGDAQQIKWYLEEKYPNQVISTATMYRMKAGQRKLLTRDHTAIKISIRCVR